MTGEQIKALRKEESLTQKEFAGRLLISQSYLSGIENGNELPNQKLIKLICLEFGVDENWLVNAEGSMYTDVYENDKAGLVDVSNKALLRIMTAFSTDSNVEYGFYAYSIDIFASLLTLTYGMDENDRLFYLELIQNFVMDFERMIHHGLSRRQPDALVNLREEAITDIDKILNHLTKVKP